MDPIKKAQDLISRGKATQNKQLIQLGEALLRKHQPEPKPNDFTMKRNPDVNRAVYDENGNRIGTKQRREPIQVSRNQFIDNRKEANDKANELLKRFTIRSPRERGVATFVEAVCSSCGKREQVNPIHAKISTYRCTECVRRLSR